MYDDCSFKSIMLRVFDILGIMMAGYFLLIACHGGPRYIPIGIAGCSVLCAYLLFRWVCYKWRNSGNALFNYANMVVISEEVRTPNQMMLDKRDRVYYMFNDHPLVEDGKTVWNK